MTQDMCVHVSLQRFHFIILYSRIMSGHDVQTPMIVDYGINFNTVPLLYTNTYCYSLVFSLTPSLPYPVKFPG